MQICAKSGICTCKNLQNVAKTCKKEKPLQEVAGATGVGGRFGRDYREIFNMSKQRDGKNHLYFFAFTGLYQAEFG
jgi:hypothetical protein